MLKPLFKKLVIATWVVLVVGCSEPIDIEASQQHFYEHEENFRQLSNGACAFADENRINFFRYPLDVNDENAEEFEKAFDELEGLLAAVDSELIVIQDFVDANCELFVLIAGTSFLGEGSSLGYVYQPIELGEYEYTEDFFSADQIAHREANRTRGEDVKFSIDLKGGWYLRYHLYP